jgi:hypothetical protein
MDAPTMVRADSGPLSPAKRSVELKRRSVDPADSYVPVTSAPKLHCTFSAKLVDLMSNFSVVDGDALAAGGGDADGSDCSEGAPAGRAADAAGAAGKGGERAEAEGEAAARAAAARAAADDASSVVSEQAVLEPVPEERALTEDDAGSGEPKPAGPPAPGGLAAVFEAFGARSVASAAPADVAAAAAAHLKEHPAVCLDTLYVYDLAQVARMHAAWVAALPRVRPYYGERAAESLLGVAVGLVVRAGGAAGAGGGGSRAHACCMLPARALRPSHPAPPLTPAPHAAPSSRPRPRSRQVQPRARAAVGAGGPRLRLRLRLPDGARRGGHPHGRRPRPRHLRQPLQAPRRHHAGAQAGRGAHHV